MISDFVKDVVEGVTLNYGTHVPNVNYIIVTGVYCGRLIKLRY